jgi:hypothetical protein
MKNSIFEDGDVPLKRRFLQEPHGVITQKAAFLAVNSMKTSNLATSHQLQRRLPQKRPG